MNKILMFDDDDVIRMLYEEELFEEGYDVICSGDAGDASRCFELISFGLAILFCKLVRMDHGNGMVLGVFLLNGAPAFPGQITITVGDQFNYARSAMEDGAYAPRQKTIQRKSHIFFLTSKGRIFIIYLVD